MAQAPKKINNDIEKCSYGCGQIAKYQYKNGKYCCSDSKNKCPRIRKKNSDGINKNGVWNKGKSKYDDNRIMKYSISGGETRRKQVKDGVYNVWNKGLSVNDERVFNNIKNLSKQRKGYYHTLKYFVDKYGVEKGEEVYLELNDKKKQTLQNYINRYGENEGVIKYEKQLNSKKSINFYSKISQELFDNIIKNINFEKIYYATYNKEYGIRYKNKYYFYDFVILDNKKIIEFNGDIWHCNPNIYNNDNKPFCYEKIDLNDIWNFDREKLKIPEKQGFDILVIWENEYKNNKEKIIHKCLKFLNDE